MAGYLLRIEGVNFASTMLDTTDLSTVRGASFLYLEAITRIDKILRGRPEVGRVETLSQGGSVGLFSLDLADGASPTQIRDALEAELPKSNKLFSHLTFVVDLVKMREPPALPPSEDADEQARAFLHNRERVIAANRWRQQQSPSLVAPSPQSMPGGDRETSKRVCEFDLVRPGSIRSELIKGKQNRCLSDSVNDRRRYGIDCKFYWYQEFLRRPLDAGGRAPFADFANDMADLADPGSDGPNLKGKIAVFYADGNGFGRIQDDLIRGKNPWSAGPPEHRQRDWDDRLRHYRRLLLERVLDTVAGSKAGLQQLGEMTKKPLKEEVKLRKPPGKADDKRPNLRLETLYAAGDEGMWIVPASLGWTLAATFFAETLGRDIETGRQGPRPGWTIGDHVDAPPLHHAAGLVFCHHDAPITRIQTLARNLAEIAKAHDRSQSLLCYQVLESFDHIGRDLDAFRRERCPAGIAPSQMIVPGEKMGPVLGSIDALKSGKKLPRRQLKRLALTLHMDGAGESVSALEKTLRDEYPRGADLAADLAPLRDCFGDGQALWLHLDDLWDFLVKPEAASAVAPAQAEGAA
ncbi:MAG: hypothetical protein IPM60_01875 [Rhodospirillales bacterium]|nr:hypothetical protein [Rhodospirillales bacterium]